MGEYLEGHRIKQVIVYKADEIALQGTINGHSYQAR